MKSVFSILIFFEVGHQFAKKFVKNELLQTIQTVITASKRFVKSSSTRKTRATVTVTLAYSSKWTTDKKTFRKTLTDFWNNIEIYRTIKQFHNFQSKIESVSEFSDFSLSFSSNFFEIFIFVSNFSKNFDFHLKISERNEANQKKNQSKKNSNDPTKNQNRSKSNILWWDRTPRRMGKGADGETIAGIRG